MKTKIELDWKSVAIGGITAAIILFATGATTASETYGGSPGHYQVSVGGDGRAAVVDTVSGQTWTTQIQTGGGPTTVGTTTFAGVKLGK